MEGGVPWLCVAVAAVVLVCATQCQTGIQPQGMEPAGGAAVGDGWVQGPHEDLLPTPQKLCHEKELF